MTLRDGSEGALQLALGVLGGAVRRRRLGVLRLGELPSLPQDGVEVSRERRDGFAGGRAYPRIAPRRCLAGRIPVMLGSGSGGAGSGDGGLEESRGKGGVSFARPFERLLAVEAEGVGVAATCCEALTPTIGAGLLGFAARWRCIEKANKQGRSVQGSISRRSRLSNA